MANNNYQLPYQRISMAQKHAKDNQWFKDNIDALVPYGNNAGYEMENWEDALRNYRLYNNIITKKDIQDECGELVGNMAVDVAQIEKAIIPYNITYRKIDKLLGEEGRRGFNASIYLLNDYDIQSRTDELKNAIRASVLERVEWAELMMTPELQQMTPQDQDKLKEELITTQAPEDIDQQGFLSNKQILGHKLMELGMFRERVEHKRRLGFKHALLSDVEVIFVGEDRGNAYMEVLNPLRTGYIKSPDEEMVHKGIAAWYRVPMYIQDVLDTKGQYLSKKDFKKLSDRLKDRTFSRNYGNDMRGDGSSYLTQAISRKGAADSDINGQHGKLAATNDYCWFTYCQWRGSREVGFHTFTNDYGDEETVVVDVKFEIPADATKTEYIDIDGLRQQRYEWVNQYGETESIEYEWINRTYEGFRIDSDIYGSCRELPNQHTSAENPYDSHLTFYGATYNETNASSISMMSRMRPFQYLYLTIIDKIKELTAKEQGMLSAYDTTQIDPALADPDTGRDELQMQLYYEQAHSAVYYNSLLNKYSGREVMQRPSGFQTMPKSNASFIQSYMVLADWCEQQIGNASSVTAHREGQTAERDSVRNVQSNVMHASDITEHYFITHNYIWQNAIEGYVSKQRKLFKKQLEQGDEFMLNYVLPDSMIQTLKITRDDVEDSDFGIHVMNSGANADFMRRLDSYSQMLIQNDKVLATDVMEIMEAMALGKSMTTVKRMMTVSTKKQQEQKMAELDKQNEAIKQAEEMKAQEADKAHGRAIQILDREFEHEKEITKMKIEGDIDKAMVVGMGFAADQDMNTNAQHDIVDARNAVQKQELQKTDINIKGQKQKLDIKALSLKEKQLKLQEKSKGSK